jgi:hypothetical protein
MEDEVTRIRRAQALDESPELTNVMPAHDQFLDGGVNLPS